MQAGQLDQHPQVPPWCWLMAGLEKASTQAMVESQLMRFTVTFRRVAQVFSRK